MNPLVPLILCSVFSAPILKPPAPRKLPRVADASPELRQELHKLDAEYRGGSAEKFVELERRAGALAEKYTGREDLARIWGQVAHVAAQSGLAYHTARVRRYAGMSLALSRDPLLRGQMRSYLACAVPLGGHDFPRGRVEAAEILLEGYAELLAQGLPEKAPELAGLGKFRRERGDAAEEAEARAWRERQLAARAESEFIREQVSRRDTLVMQLRDLFKPEPKSHGRNPEGPAELRKLARRWLKEREIDALLEKVTR